LKQIPVVSVYHERIAVSEKEQVPRDRLSEIDHSAADMTDAELAEAKQYGRLDLACAVADKAIDVAYLAVAAFVLAAPIDRWLQSWPWLAGESSLHQSLRLAALLLAIMAINVVVSFPLSFYSGHVLEHRFKLSTLSFGGWLWRYVKRNGLAVAFMLAAALGLYWLIWSCGAAWWLVAAGVFFVITIVLGQLMPVVFLPLFYRIEKLDAPELADRIARLAEGTGLSIEGVYRMGLSEETVKANAMLAGLGRTRRVLLSDTLLQGFLPEEIEVIFAHEIGHHVFRHLRKLLLGMLCYSAAGFWICDRLLIASSGGAVDYARLPVATLPLVLLILTIFGLLLEPLQNAVSRRFERQSDRYALVQTGLKGAYLSAFRKLARLNKDDPNPHWLEVFLFHSHPPIAQRLAMAEEVLGSE
jgi:STE24 endopeptidase